MTITLSQEEKDRQGVVSLDDEVWKNIPFYSQYEASSHGRIRRKTNPEKIIHGNKTKTTKGYYRSIVATSDDLVKKTTGIHRLICLAFHPLPYNFSFVVYEPNHKDGNKLNNHKNNLEWVTRSQNVLHAFETGLCQVGIRVEAKNIKTGQVYQYNSLSAAARAFNKPRAVLRNIMSQHRETPYDGQWIFKLDVSSDRKLKRHQAREVIVKDYTTGEVTVYRDSASAGDATGVKILTVNFRVSPYNKMKERYSLISGYVFKALSDKTPWPEYSKEEAIQSREEYLSRGKKKLEVTDLQLNTTKIYDQIDDFAEEVGRDKSTIYGAIRNDRLVKWRYRLRLI